ncbi:unnamed protein product [Pneumocystis jirovecii]|uniref:Beta-catenin-like protein 1 N-terminal domain-containing protein n=1 Tax=Pneumocystis jirovecii TaxID=42068 RepID=L0P8C4_PNEJI|nr:unnamed protein product [Pneumocystis jirovecii]
MKREEKESEIYIDLLDSGLYCLQAIDLILAWLFLELLKTYGKDISSIKTVLQEYINNMSVDDIESDKLQNIEDGKEIAKTLLELL